LIWMELVVRLSPSSPILWLLCKSQVCKVGISCLSAFPHRRTSRFSVDVALIFSSIVYPLVFLVST
jgi:hypothetical protein